MNRPLKVAVLCSRRAPGLLQLLNRDPRRGRDYDVVCCVSSEELFDEQVRVERRGLPCIPHPVRAFYHRRDARLRDLSVRAEYDAETLRILEPYHPDLLLLDGYLLLLTQPVLDAFDGRILNVHHSDLLLRDAAGQPKYPGLRAVADAIAAGETETRASTHLVTDRMDDGPVILRSWAFPVGEVVTWAREREAWDVLRAASWAHQEWMLREGWWPMLARSIELAGNALETAGARLDARVGRWVLAQDGSLVADERVMEVV